MRYHPGPLPSVSPLPLDARAKRHVDNRIDPAKEVVELLLRAAVVL